MLTRAAGLRIKAGGSVPHSPFICAFSFNARLSSTIARVSRLQYASNASWIFARSTQSVSTKTIR